jgi:hypothetical protein
MRAATGPETVRKDFEIDLIDLVEDRHSTLLDDLVLHCRDAQYCTTSRAGAGSSFIVKTPVTIVFFQFARPAAFQDPISACEEL